MKAIDEPRMLATSVQRAIAGATGGSDAAPLHTPILRRAAMVDRPPPDAEML